MVSHSLLVQAVDELFQSYPVLFKRCGNRIESAMQIAETPGAIEVVGEWLEDKFIVKSQSNPAGSYQVDFNTHSCTCPDHGKHNAAGIVCKHRLACWFYKSAYMPDPTIKTLAPISSRPVISTGCTYLFCTTPVKVLMAYAGKCEIARVDGQPWSDRGNKCIVVKASTLQLCPI